MILQITQASKLITEKRNNRLSFSFNTVSESYINDILVKLNQRKAVGLWFHLSTAFTLISSCPNATADQTD